MDNLVHGVHQILSQTELDPRCLELEVTENLTMQDAARTTVVMRALSEMGVGVEPR